VTSRFITNFAALIAGAVLITGRFAFVPGIVRWIALGVGAAAIIIGLWSFALRRQPALQRLIDVALAAVGGWTIFVSCVWTPRHGLWFEFAAGAALAGVGALGLVVREARLSATLHALEASAMTRIALPQDGGGGG